MALTARLGSLILAAAFVATPFFVAAALITPAWAQEADKPMLPMTPPAPFKPDASTGPGDPTSGSPVPDTWIFSGALQSSHEAFSGTLVTGKAETQFELRLAGGATCSGGDLKGEVGLVRLSQITCSDDRTMRALFVPQGGETLRVFGHVGEERFTADAHLLGAESIPDKPQTKAPKAPTSPPARPPG